MKEKFIIKGQGGDKPPEILELEVKPLTAIYKDGNFNGELEPLNRVVLDAQQTVYHAERCKVWHKETEKWVEELKPGAFIATDSAAMHLKGLVDLSLKFRDMKVPFMWRYPETFLHPRVQAQLADFAIYLTQEAL